MDTEPLETIDLGREAATPQWRWSRPMTALLAVVLSVAVGLWLAFASPWSDGEQATPRRASMVPRFTPLPDAHGATSFVLPSGYRVVLSGSPSNLIGRLGASFAGSVAPKLPRTCCSLTFGIYHAPPGDLFETLESYTRTTPIVVSPTRAKFDELGQSARGFGIVSTGDWTLVATMNGATPDDYDTTLLEQMQSWRLRSTPDGAVLNVPRSSTIDYASVVLGRTPDLSDRQIELTTAEPCITRQDTGRNVTDSNSPAVGHWCVHGVLIRIEGPRSYVTAAIADLRVAVELMRK